MKLSCSVVHDINFRKREKRDQMHLWWSLFRFISAGEQLISSKISDVKFYTRRYDEAGEKIMKTIKNYSAARFICDNTRLEKVQRNIFNVPSDEYVGGFPWLSFFLIHCFPQQSANWLCWLRKTPKTWSQLLVDPSVTISYIQRSVEADHACNINHSYIKSVPIGCRNRQVHCQNF